MVPSGISRATTSAGVVASSQLPAGFFDDARTDAAAQGVDFAAAARATKDAEVSAFLSWAKTVEDDEAGRLLADEAAAEDKAAAASAENGLYRARVAVLRDLVEGRVGGGGAAGGSGGGGPGGGGAAVTAAAAVGEGVLVINEDELLSLGVAAPNSGAVGLLTGEVAATLTERVRRATAVAAAGSKRGRAAGGEREDTDEAGEDLLDWRRKR